MGFSLTCLLNICLVFVSVGLCLKHVLPCWRGWIDNCLYVVRRNAKVLMCFALPFLFVGSVNFLTDPQTKRITEKPGAYKKETSVPTSKPTDTRNGTGRGGTSGCDWRHFVFAGGWIWDFRWWYDAKMNPKWLFIKTTPVLLFPSLKY